MIRIIPNKILHFAEIVGKWIVSPSWPKHEACGAECLNLSPLIDICLFGRFEIPTHKNDWLCTLWTKRNLVRPYFPGFAAIEAGVCD
jgi:hypothetical protein